MPSPSFFQRAAWVCVLFAFQILCAPSAVHGATTTPPGLTHRWSFLESSGVTLLDSIGSAHGTLTTPDNATPNALLGGGTLRLGGGNRDTASYAVFPAGLLDGSTDFTVEIWASPEEGIGAWARIFEFGTGVEPATSFLWSFQIGEDINSQRFEFLPVGTKDSNLPTTLGRRYHYVVTWDSKKQLLSWYRDALLVANVSTSGHSLSEIPDDVFWLGRSHYGGDATAAASYDEVRLWNRALSAAEIQLYDTKGPQSLAPQQSDISASDDTAQVGVGAGALIDVLANDSPLLDAATITIVSGPTLGTVEVLSSGQIRYAHTGNTTGSDQFVYRVTDWSRLRRQFTSPFPADESTQPDSICRPKDRSPPITEWLHSPA